MAPGQDTFKTNACVLMLILVRNHPNTLLQSHQALTHQDKSTIRERVSCFNEKRTLF